MHYHQHSTTRHGSVLALALIMAGILIALGAASLVFINDKYRVVYQAAGWQEALMTADAGVDVAISELRRDLLEAERDQVWMKPEDEEEAEKQGEWKIIADDPDDRVAPASTTAAWDVLRASYDIFNGQSTGQEVKAGLFRTFVPNTEDLEHTGEGATHSYIAEITVDVPHVEEKGAMWFRIRSRGIAQVPGGATAAGSREDIRLRKLDLRADDGPQASRTVEAIVRPVFASELTLLARDEIDMNNPNIFLASYDSSDPNQSTNGQYDGNKYVGRFANIAAIGGIIDAGDATVWGRAATNGGDIENSENIKGNYDNDPDRLRKDFDMELLPVKAPTITGTPVEISGDWTIQADYASTAPTYALISDIKLGGGGTLEIKGDPTGKDTTVIMLVEGDIDVKGNGLIKIGAGVHLRLFLKGDADFGGNGISNPEPNTPANLQIYGIDRPADDPDPIGDIKIAGTASFTGTVYAPNYDIAIVGGGNNDSSVSGAFVGRNIRMTGVSQVYYDEDLASEGLVIGYRIASWFEDER